MVWTGVRGKFRLKSKEKKNNRTGAVHIQVYTNIKMATPAPPGLGSPSLLALSCFLDSR